jgi:MFS superfamily sulfate permease-like transporter
LAIFLVTIIFTLFEDLLIGIAAGMLLKIIIHLFHGVPLRSLFKVPVEISFEGDDYLVVVDKAALFTNFIGIKNKLESIPSGFNVTIDLNNTKVTDHSVMKNLDHFKHDYEATGGHVTIIGLDDHKSLSKHHLAARKKTS